MSKSTQIRTSAQSYDGGLPCVMMTPTLTFATAAKTAQAIFVAPCDLEIVAAQYGATTAATSAAAAVNLLTATGGTRISVNVQNQTALDFTLATGWAAGGKTVKKGGAIVVGLAAATAVGVCGVTLVGMPT